MLDTINLRVSLSCSGYRQIAKGGGSKVNHRAPCWRRSESVRIDEISLYLLDLDCLAAACTDNVAMIFATSRALAFAEVRAFVPTRAGDVFAAGLLVGLADLLFTLVFAAGFAADLAARAGVTALVFAAGFAAALASTLVAGLVAGLVACLVSVFGAAFGAVFGAGLAALAAAATLAPIAGAFLTGGFVDAVFLDTLATVLAFAGSPLAFFAAGFMLATSFLGTLAVLLFFGVATLAAFAKGDAPGLPVDLDTPVPLIPREADTLDTTVSFFKVRLATEVVDLPVTFAALVLRVEVEAVIFEATAFGVFTAFFSAFSLPSAVYFEFGDMAIFSIFTGLI